MTREEAAEYLRMSVRTLEREAAAGNIKPLIVAQMPRYNLEILDEYIRRQNPLYGVNTFGGESA